MVDKVDFITWPKHQNLFYSVTTSCILIEAKATGNACIGLARSPGPTCECWICIGDNGRCWIKQGDANTKYAMTPRVLSSSNFRMFWITWYNGFIRLGKHGDKNPIVSAETKFSDLMFITFSSYRDRDYVEWSYNFPPILKQPRRKQITRGFLEWANEPDRFPKNALVAGFENECLYIARIMYRESLTPGKLVPSEGVAYIPWGGEANQVSTYEVLCGYDCEWVASSEDKVPVGAFVAGYSEIHGEPIFIGRVRHEGHLIPGKVQPSHKVCYIPYQDKEIAFKEYEILIEPYVNLQAATKEYITIDHECDSEAEDVDRDNEDFWPNGREYEERSEQEYYSNEEEEDLIE